jgi:hypothetical protein
MIKFLIFEKIKMQFEKNLYKKIALELDYPDIVNFSRTCKYIYKNIYCNKQFWLEKIEKDTGIDRKKLMITNNSRNLAKFIWLYKKNPLDGLEKSLYIQNFPLIEYFLEKGQCDIVIFVRKCVVEGYLEIANYFVNKMDFDETLIKYIFSPISPYEIYPNIRQFKKRKT